MFMVLWYISLKDFDLAPVADLACLIFEFFDT